MGLELVTLTGADDGVNPQELNAISAKFPSVEWAILYSLDKEGTARNPSAPWRERFLALGLTYTAAHLCGTSVFRAILDPERSQALMADLQRYRRIQVNINARKPEFTSDEVLTVYRALHKAGLRLILQYHAESAEVIDQFISELDEEGQMRVDLLVDGSRGKGIKPEAWPEPFDVPTFTGYAGGLGPEVIATELTKIRASVAKTGSDKPFWIDMESGIRTDNQFDLEKVRRVLAHCYS